jgi:hypothetical protein
VPRATPQFIAECRQLGHFLEHHEQLGQLAWFHPDQELIAPKRQKVTDSANRVSAGTADSKAMKSSASWACSTRSMTDFTMATMSLEATFTSTTPRG